MRDHAHSRPGSRAGGITSAITAAASLHSHSTSISSFTDLSASSTNIYPSHARRVRSVRKLRQILGPDDDGSGNVERMEALKDKELPLLPSPLLSPTPPVPPNKESTVYVQDSLSDILSSEDETGGKSTSLVYARRVKLEKLKRRLGEDVPKELIFYDQPGPSSPTSPHRVRSLSSPNVMTFAESEFPRGHTKNVASVSTISSPNESSVALKRSKPMLRLWKPKANKLDDLNTLEVAIEEISIDDAKTHKPRSGRGHVTAIKSFYPTQLTSLAGSEGLNGGFLDDDFAMDSQSDSVENNTTGVQVIRSRSTLVVDRTSEDDERTHVSSLVEPLKKPMFLSIIESSPIDLERQLDIPHLFLEDKPYQNSGRRPSRSDSVHALRKTRSAIALASESRIQATTTDPPPIPKLSLPHSAKNREPSTPSTTPSPTSHSSHRSHHKKENTWSDENLTSEDDKRTGRPVQRGSKPKGPRPSSQSRLRSAEDGRKHSDDAVEHWQLLELQRRLSSNSPSLDPLLSTRDLPPPPPPTKASKHSKSKSSGVSPAAPLKTSSAHKTSTKTLSAVIYFYHRGVVRVAVEDGAKGTVQTVHMRDVLNYLREMRYVH